MAKTINIGSVKKIDAKVQCSPDSFNGLPVIDLAIAMAADGPTAKPYSRDPEIRCS
jgi:hypothetical protein